MLELLKNYSISDILIFLIILSAATKGIVSFGQWVYEQFNKIIKRETAKEKAVRENKEMLASYHDSIQKISGKQDDIESQVKEICDKIRILMDSDRDDIKAFITEKHHYFCYEKRWIDDFSLNSILKRYDHYQDEGGNSFVGGLVDEIKALPKRPPNE